MIEALLDSNVVVAILAENHLHHDASFALLGYDDKTRFGIAAHGFAEAYNTLTRTGKGLKQAFAPDKAMVALDNLRQFTELLGLTPTQTFNAIRGFAQSGGIGPRLYDRLIGEVAAVHGIPAIVTWNSGHMRSLFPALRIVTPTAWIEADKAAK